MRLGCVCDVEVDTATARIVSLVIFGRYRWFGLLGREDDIVINWCDIQLIGEDTILVNFCLLYTSVVNAYSYAIPLQSVMIRSALNTVSFEEKSV